MCVYLVELKYALNDNLSGCFSFSCKQSAFRWAKCRRNALNDNWRVLLHAVDLSHAQDTVVVDREPITCQQVIDRP